eukprot:GEMP01014426.1.p1 GENE.GEMP01014426.1~~GEMP01014426.1.p1  ORF type:complete len:425 (+),score=108.24 GEMP01014426.1:61-1275(+)
MAAVLKLRGLPWSVSEHQIVEFFRPIPVGIESITLISGPDGRPSGEGYVWIHENNMNQALSYNRGNIGTRYVEVFPSTEAEYTSSVQYSGVGGGPAPIAAPRPSGGGAPRPMAEQNASEPVVRVRGLPFSATPQDLIGLFADYGVDDSNVYMGIATAGQHCGSPNGDAFIRFSSVEVAQKALNIMQGTTLGSRYLELFATTESEIEAKANSGALAGYEANLGSGSGDLNPQENRFGSGWIRLRGLPYTATQRDCVEFLGCDYGLTEADVTIKYGTDGRPSGEAFVQVDSEDTAYSAQQTLDRKNMGSRFIEVFVSSHEESQAIRTNRPGPYSGGGGGGKQAGGAKGFAGGKGYGGGKDAGGGKGYGGGYAKQEYPAPPFHKGGNAGGKMGGGYGKSVGGKGGKW